MAQGPSSRAHGEKNTGERGIRHQLKGDCYSEIMKEADAYSKERKEEQEVMGCFPCPQ